MSGAYDLTMHGPHGLFRRWSGDRRRDTVETGIRMRGAAVVTTIRAVTGPVTVTVTNAYGSAPARTLVVRDEREITVETRSTGGWYDLRVEVAGQPFAREFAGHLEDGVPSISDPAFGR